MVPISRAVGRKRALEMLLTGELIDALTALEWGLVNRVVPVETLSDAVDDLALVDRQRQPLTVAIGKQAFYAQIDVDERQAYDLTVPVMTMNAMTDDAAEGISVSSRSARPSGATGRARQRWQQRAGAAVARTATAPPRRLTTRRRLAPLGGRVGPGDGEVGPSAS